MKCLEYIFASVQLRIHQPYLSPLPDSKDTRYEVVEKIVTKILKSNEDISKISNTNWNISVVHSKSEITCALPNGKIFIFTGIFKTVNDDDQLALLLSHEIGT